MQSWLWPDRTIGKRESRQLREEHNELVNEHAAMLDALRWCISELCIDGTNSPKMAEFRALIAAIEGDQ